MKTFSLKTNLFHQNTLCFILFQTSNETVQANNIKPFIKLFRCFRSVYRDELFFLLTAPGSPYLPAQAAQGFAARMGSRKGMPLQPFAVLAHCTLGQSGHNYYHRSPRIMLVMLISLIAWIIEPDQHNQRNIMRRSLS